MNVIAAASFLVIAIIGSFGLGYSYRMSYSKSKSIENVSEQKKNYEESQSKIDQDTDEPSKNHSPKEEVKDCVFFRIFKFISDNDKVINVLIALSVAIFTAVLVIANIGLWRASNKQTRKLDKSIDIAQISANAARDQLVLAYPPRITAINPIIHPKGRDYDPVKMEPNEDIDGNIQFLLTGRDAAKVNLIKTVHFWTDKPLPMFRAYNGDIPSNMKCDGPFWIQKGTPPALYKHPIEGIFTMGPGDIISMTFETKVPDDYATREQSLYIFGYIQFDDPLTKNRYSLFARRYDPGLGRFVIIKNPDYQRENENTLGNPEE